MLQKLYISEDKNIDKLKEGLTQMETDPLVECIFILACDNNQYELGAINKLLKSCTKPVWGGIFPSIIHNKNRFENGVIILGLESKISLAIIKGLSNPNKDFEAELEEISFSSLEPNTLSIIVDGLSKCINSLIEALFLVIGLDYKFIGGGAGSLSMKQKPCVITNEGLLGDCAVIAALNNECGVGVQHGWKSISGPFKVTSSDHNTIHSIDYRPAFEVYREIIKEHSGKEINCNNFFEISKAYPFGINKLCTEKVVRDPITCKGNSILCIGEIMEETFIDILHGDKKSLINAAKIAAKKSKKDIEDRDIEFMFLFDCISRVLFLEDDFDKELEAINTEKLPLIGALSMGEIANSKKDYLEFYNKTTVIATVKK